jgi:hypothetical protein
MPKLNLTEQHARESTGFAVRVPISVSRDDTRDHTDRRMLYVLGSESQVRSPLRFTPQRRHT